MLIEWVLPPLGPVFLCFCSNFQAAALSPKTWGKVEASATSHVAQVLAGPWYIPWPAERIFFWEWSHISCESFFEKSPSFLVDQLSLKGNWPFFTKKHFDMSPWVGLVRSYTPIPPIATDASKKPLRHASMEGGECQPFRVVQVGANFRWRFFWSNGKSQGSEARENKQTPKPLPTGYQEIPFIVGLGGLLWGVRYWGCVIIFLDRWVFFMSRNLLKLKRYFNFPEI